MITAINSLFFYGYSDYSKYLVFVHSFYLTILVFPFAQGPGVFEPIHGSALDIAGQVGFTFFF